MSEDIEYKIENDKTIIEIVELLPSDWGNISGQLFATEELCSSKSINPYVQLIFFKRYRNGCWNLRRFS